VSGLFEDPTYTPTPPGHNVSVGVALVGDRGSTDEDHSLNTGRAARAPNRNGAWHVHRSALADRLRSWNCRLVPPISWNEGIRTSRSEFRNGSPWYVGPATMRRYPPRPVILSYFRLCAPMATLVVPGGNGFIGREICRIAVENDHDVVAFGRSGRPNLVPREDPWVSDVEWRAADVFVPESWRDLLDGADALVHCIATIRQDPEQELTFERVNAESALVAAEEATNADVDSFVLLSVRDTPPCVSGRFLAAKRRVEQEVPGRYPSLRFVSLRPNLVFGPGRVGTGTIAAALNQLPLPSSHGYATKAGRALPVQLVAAAAVQAAVTTTLEGTLSVDQIADVGRTSGLVAPADVSEASLLPLLAGIGGATLAGGLPYRWYAD